MTYEDLHARWTVEGQPAQTQGELLAAAREAGLEGAELQKLFADLRASWSAAARGKTLEGYWRARRRGVKGAGRRYGVPMADVDTAG